MKFADIKKDFPPQAFDVLAPIIDELRPCQEKSIKNGLLKGKSLLVCTPTASGKTLVGELAILNSVLKNRGKAVYIVPLKALANEKHKDFKKKYGHLLKIALSIGDMDSADPYLAEYDLIICTAEKLDSLTRHRAPWLKMLTVVVVDEMHLINDPQRGPTLEILLTMLREQLKKIQIIGLSATIGNPEQLAGWLEANLIVDDWRPVKLYKGVYHKGILEFAE